MTSSGFNLKSLSPPPAHRIHCIGEELLRHSVAKAGPSCLPTPNLPKSQSHRGIQIFGSHAGKTVVVNASSTDLKNPKTLHLKAERCCFNGHEISRCVFHASVTKTFLSLTLLQH